MRAMRPAHHFCSLCRATGGPGAAASPGRLLEVEMSPDASYTERCPWCDNLITRAKFLEIQERIRQEERKRLAAAEAASRQREVVMLKEAQEQAERKVKNILEEAERRRTKELNDQRQILDKHKDQALLKQGAEFNRERERYQKKMKEIFFFFKQKTAYEIGDGAEIDLYEALREA